MAGNLVCFVFLTLIFGFCVTADQSTNVGNETGTDLDWYLSSNGSDTSTCGRNMSSACKTLDWLLERFYNTSYKPNLTLFLTTDTSLDINAQLLDKHLWMRNQSIVATTMSSHNDVTINFYNVSMLHSDWTIRGMNVKLTQSNTLLMNATLENSNGQTRRLAEIGNSSFGHLNIFGYEVKIDECSIDGTYILKDTLMDIKNSRLNVTNSNFYDHEVKNGPAIIKASSSDVIVQDTNFTKNVGKEGVIYILNGSNLQLQNCKLINNSHLFFTESTIVLKSNSTAVVVDCYFYGNSAFTGGCIRSNPGTNLVVENSIFMRNTAQQGGVIFCEDILGIREHSNSKLVSAAEKDLLCQHDLESVQNDNKQKCPFVMKGSYLEHNTVLSLGSGGSVFLNQTAATLFNNTFLSNYAPALGGSLIAYDSKVNVYDSSFLSNRVGLQGGALHVANHTVINIHRCSFSGTYDVKGSCVSVVHGVTLIMINSTVKEINTAFHFPWVKGFSMYFIDHVKVKIARCHFETVYPSPGIIYSEENTVVNISESVFININKSSALALSASGSVRFSFTTCTFFGTGGFSLSQNTSVHLERSLVSSSENILNNALISLSGESEIVFSYTNITNINPTLNQRFLQATSSSIYITRCLYSGNNVFRHFDASDSVILVEDSTMINNTCSDSLIPYSSIFHVSDGKLIVTRSVFNDNFHTIYVSLFLMSIIASSSSDISLTDSIFSSSSVNTSAAFVLYMRSSSVSTRPPNNYLQIDNCTFANKAGSFRIHDVADINIQSSLFHIYRNTDFQFPILIHVSGLQFSNVYNVRLAFSVFNSSKDAPTQMVFETGTKKLNIITWKTNMTVENYTIQSDNKHFLDNATNKGMINIAHQIQTKQNETPYASVIPVLCSETTGYHCYCHYNQSGKVNVYNCSSTQLDAIPPTLLNDTDWLLMENTGVKYLQGFPKVLNTIKYLDLKNSNIHRLSDDFINQLNQNKSLKWLDLSYNNLVSISSNVQNWTNLEKIWLHGNPFNCDCSMIWMIGWLNNFITPKGQHIIVDYKDIYCQSGMMKDLPIYVLNEVTMGCYPPKLTTMQEIGMAMGAGAALMIILVILLVSRNPREVKFLMYYYLKLDTVPKDDKNENVDNMDYDAFFCHSHKDIRWIKNAFWTKSGVKFDLELDYGFRFVIASRDWVAGRTIRANVMDSLEKSRRVIFILSRNFLKSKWGMEEFMIADNEAVNGRKNFIILILIEKIPKKELTKELRTYMETYTYIDATKNMKQIEKRLRFCMPYTPLQNLKTEGLRKYFGEFNFDDLDSDDEVPQRTDRNIGSESETTSNFNMVDDDENGKLLLNYPQQRRLGAQGDSDEDCDIQNEDEEAKLLRNQTTVQIHGTIN